MDALDLDVFEIRPVGRLIAEPVRQVVELEPHRVVEVLLEAHPANLLRHARLRVSPGPAGWRGARTLCTEIWYICIAFRSARQGADVRPRRPASDAPALPWSPTAAPRC